MDRIGFMSGMRWWSVLFLYLISFYSAIAQKYETYNGIYTFGGVDGEAAFRYIPERKDQQIKDGRFEFSSFKADSIDVLTYYKVAATGNYSADQKTDRWNYTEGSHRVEISDITYFNVRTILESEQMELKARYDSLGKPSGDWSFKVVSFSNEKASDLLTTKELRFRNGHLTGPVELAASEGNYYLGLQSLKGFATKDGLMDSTWTFVYMRDTLEIIEVREYDEGFLTAVKKIDKIKGDTLIDIAFEETIEKLRIIKGGSTALFSISERNFGVYYSDGFDITHRNAMTQLHGNAQLNQILDNLIKYDEPIYFVDQIQTDFPLRTKRFEFKLLPAEDSLAEAIGRAYPKILAKVDSLKSNTSFTFNQQRTDSLFLAHKYLEIIDSILGRLDYIMRKAGSDQVKYYDLQEYQSTNEFGFMHIDSVKIEFKDTLMFISKDFNQGVDPGRNLLHRLSHYIDALETELNTLEASVLEQLGQLSIGDEVESLEAQILARRKEAIQRYAAYQAQSENEKAFFEDMVNKFFKKTYNEFIDSYSRDNMEEERLKRARAYLDLLNSIDGYQQTFQRIFANQRNIEKMYKEEVFNPFTFTTYDRPVKEQIYKSGLKVFESYVDEIKQTSDPEAIDSLLNDILALQVRMGELKSEDTRNLERSLRNVKDKDQILSQFGMEKQ